MRIEFTLNGESARIESSAETLLVDLLRREFGLSGARPGCMRGQCGNCAVLFNGALTRACLLPVFRLEGCEVMTIEGFLRTKEFADIEYGFERAGMDPCRFCISSKVLVAHSVLLTELEPSDLEIERATSGVWCRCTSYSSFVNGIRYAAHARKRRYNERNF